MARVAIHGVAGRMGLSIVRALREGDARLVGGIDREASVGKDVGTLSGHDPSGVLVTGDLDVALRDANVLIDFTHPTASVPLFAELASSTPSICDEAGQARPSRSRGRPHSPRSRPPPWP